VLRGNTVFYWKLVLQDLCVAVDLADRDLDSEIAKVHKLATNKAISCCIQQPPSPTL
jgi:hypothetical protein